MLSTNVTTWPKKFGVGGGHVIYNNIAFQKCPLKLSI
jgi:hypothetical protein